MANSVSSGLISATAATTIAVGRNSLTGVTAIGDGTNIATVTVYDSASGATGTILARVLAPATGSNSIDFGIPVKCEGGLVIAVTGTGTPTGIVHFGGA